MYFSIVNKAFLSFVSDLFDFTELKLMRRKKRCVKIHIANVYSRRRQNFDKFDFSCKWIAKISLIPCKPLYFPESFKLHSSLISDYQ